MVLVKTLFSAHCGKTRGVNSRRHIGNWFEPHFALARRGFRVTRNATATFLGDVFDSTSQKLQDH